MKKLVKPLLAVLLFTAASASMAQQAPKPEQVIKWRQSVYQVLAWNNGRIKNNVEGSYNKDEVIRAANAIAAIANSGLGALYPAGTETGKGWRETTVKPELFTETAKAGEAAKKFITESNELAKLAATGDAAAVKVQFGKLGQTCKGCHDDFRKKD
ncbi:MAG: cytochrome c [Zoogloea oleivorans]|jgi:cytochrome c556|uniref:c-type cytochrome n=1 Tax=Zoogloea oleivorans TaxID=1552750 RepID=UPI002A363147|nr:cytochrome c [Zoogloea oleivorans]MDY0037952.1 cytochrome c [Zoogloea oleivorans]